MLPIEEYRAGAEVPKYKTEREYFERLLRRLNRYLKMRIGQIDRWKNVEVYSPWDDLPRGLINDDNYKFYVVWSGSKTETNANDPELRAYFMWDIHNKINRTVERLNNERKVYK